MNKEQFTAVLTEYGYHPTWIEELWRTRPEDEPNENRVRHMAAEWMKVYSRFKREFGKK